MSLSLLFVAHDLAVVKAISHRARQSVAPLDSFVLSSSGRTINVDWLTASQ
ncbi:hypothetical protein PQR75_25485 [Paraburkholderia fungorum]|uniref:hypothetical protein n=1 Tax=Paraburkholderia fungorum TaxID=134537 RepID=UPI0038B9DF95